MNFSRRIGAAFIAVLLALFAVTPPALRAQDSDARWENWDHWSHWWFGLYGGANINLFSGEIHDLGTATGLTNVAAPTGFDGGSGLGLALGGIIEYNPGGLLGGNLMLGYDNRSIIFDTKNEAAPSPTGRGAEDLTARIGYFTIEPNLRINLGYRFLHATIGPSFGVLLSKAYDYTFTDETSAQAATVKGDLANLRSFLIGGQVGIGYDIPLRDATAGTQILLTPFAQFRLGQDLLDVPDGSANSFSVNTIRFGLQLKFGSARVPPTSAPEGAVAADFTVRAPNVVTESRRLQETFPLRNYIFFDEGSTAIPDRYKRVTNAESFREEQLIRPSAETGGSEAMQMRSRRQMEVYYNVMNVFGDRLRRNPSATIKLVGSANGDAATGRKMAENVRDYLVSTFGVDSKRITVEGKTYPEHRSGSSASRGEDRKMIDMENYRVEITGTPADVMQPVNITSIQEEPIDNDVVITVPNRDDIAYWNVSITPRGGQVREYGPYRNTTIARIDSKELLGTSRDSRYTVKVTMTTKDNQTLEGTEREFRLVRADEGEEQTGQRYSILFEFDESKTVQTYETFLAQTVAPAIEDGSSVIIHGHTDVTGEPDYNSRLSQRRSEEAQKILTRELTKAGKTVTFDTYGFGEDERRTPFNNTLPEQRYYNRTVVIEVVPGR